MRPSPTVAVLSPTVCRSYQRDLLHFYREKGTGERRGSEVPPLIATLEVNSHRRLLDIMHLEYVNPRPPAAAHTHLPPAGHPAQARLQQAQQEGQADGVDHAQPVPQPEQVYIQSIMNNICSPFISMEFTLRLCAGPRRPWSGSCVTWAGPPTSATSPCPRRGRATRWGSPPPSGPPSRTRTRRAR